MHFKPIALVALFPLMFLTTPLAGQESTAFQRDPAIAVGLAWLCPGCGHLYTGETTKGTVIAAVALGSLAGGFVVQMSRTSRFERALDCRSSGPWWRCEAARADLTPVLVGGAISIAAWAYGLIDARASANRMNIRHGLQVGGIDIDPVGIDGAMGARFSFPLP
jgi:hypothetical protein